MKERMKERKKDLLICLPLLALLAAGLLFTILTPADELSVSERRKLAQPPAPTLSSLASGKFFTSLESYLQDQFVLRGELRALAAGSRLYLFMRGDSNGLVLKDGAIYKPEYPYDESAAKHAAGVLASMTGRFSPSQRVFWAVIPEKSGYAGLAKPSFDETALRALLRESLPGAAEIDLSACLGPDDYYRTDIHWRQERLGPVYDRIAEGMGLSLRFSDTRYETNVVSPFYGVLYGQLALPVQPEELIYLTSSATDSAAVYDYETDAVTAVYAMPGAQSMDMYDIFLGGAKSCLRITNENAATDKSLVIFRDSFGSSIAPLFLPEYREVILIDIRYLKSAYLDTFLTFTDQDVLFLYSSLILNNGKTLQ